MRSINGSEGSYRRTTKRIGRGIVNRLINKLPVELHIPGYNFCGPGTKLATRLSRGDQGVNELDEACKRHDIAYADNSDLASRHVADKDLYKKAKERFLSKDASIGEKLSSAVVSLVMKAKTAMGMGIGKRSKSTRRRRFIRKGSKRGGQLPFSQAVSLARQAISRTGSSNIYRNAKAGYNALRKYRKSILRPRGRVIKIPKTGGFLPLIPLFAALGALGSLGGGAAAIAKAVNEAKIAREQLQEAERHNRAMEPKAIGSGFYIKPYKQGCGIYLSKSSKN